MSINPKDYRQCWSCKYCEDVGTHTYEDYVTYMRQCNHSRLDVIDKVPLHCEHYVWDGTTREFWRETASASSYRNSSSSGSGSSASTSDSESDGSILLGILVIVGALVVIGVIIALFNRVTQPKEAVLPEDISPTISETLAPEPTEDPADYSLSGSIRFVSTQSGNGVNMRSNPRADADVVSGIPEYQPVTIHKTMGNWAYVSFDGIEGWCNMDYLITEEEHFQQMQEYLNISAIVATETSPLRLRATPSLDSEILESMPKGSEVIVMRMEGDWAYVDYQGMSGWCSLQYLDLQD